jgi:hypothetical protein
METIAYKTKELEVSFADLDKYMAPVSPRDLRTAHVRRIAASLETNPSLEGVVCVNLDLKLRKMVVLDGNHRMAASRLFLENNQKKKVRMTFHIYEGLTPAQSLSITKKANASVIQDKADMIQLYCYETTAYKMLLNPKTKIVFPCNVALRASTARNTIRFMALLAAHLNRKTLSFRTLDKRNMPKLVESVDVNDVKQMAEFMEDFIKMFGEPRANINGYSNAPFLIPLYKLYNQATNAGESRERFVERVQKNFNSYRPKIDRLCGSRGMGVGEELYEALREMYNYHLKTPLPSMIQLVESKRLELAEITGEVQ